MPGVLAVLAILLGWGAVDNTNPWAFAIAAVKNPSGWEQWLQVNRGKWGTDGITAGTSSTPGGTVAPSDFVSTGTTGGAATGGVTGAQVVADAAKYLGVPYLWGGTNPKVGLDCSGFVQLVYSDLGFSLPRTTSEQYLVGGLVTSTANLQPGDLIFLRGVAGVPTHVVMFAGTNGQGQPQIISAPHTGETVRYDTLADELSVDGPIVVIRRILGYVPHTASA